MSSSANEVLVKYGAVFSFVCGRASVRHFGNKGSVGLFNITVKVVTVLKASEAVAGKKRCS